MATKTTTRTDVRMFAKGQDDEEFLDMMKTLVRDRIHDNADRMLEAGAINPYEPWHNVQDVLDEMP